MSAETEHPGSSAESPPRIPVLPRTRLGWWALGLATSFCALVLVGTVVPRGGAVAVVSGLAGGVAALVAIARRGERGLTVFAAIVPLVMGSASL